MRDPLFDLLFRLIQDPEDALRGNGKGEILELLVESLFRRLPGWVSQRPTSTFSGDFGADIIATSLRGTKYVIQCKNHAQPIGVDDVAKTHAARDFYGGSKAIVISISGFTEPAKTLAQNLGVVLWGLDELRLLFEAARSDEAKKRLGLWEESKEYSKISEVLARTESTLPSSRISRFSALWRNWRKKTYLGFLLVVAVGFALTLSLTAPFRAKPLLKRFSEADVRQVILGYDQAYRQAQASGNLSILYPWAEKAFVEQSRFSRDISSRQQRGCVMQIEERHPLRIESISYAKDTIRVSVKKDWVMTEYCLDGSAKRHFVGPFAVSYSLKPSAGRLKVASATVNQGEDYE